MVVTRRGRVVGIPRPGLVVSVGVSYPRGNEDEPSGRKRSDRRGTVRETRHPMSPRRT